MKRLTGRGVKSFAVVVLVLSALVMGYVIYEIRYAKQQFADQLITQSIAQTESELDNFFQRISDLIRSLESQYESGFWQDLSDEKVLLHAISLISNYTPVSSIAIADRSGNEMNIIPDRESGEWLVREVSTERWGELARWSRWRLGDSLQRVREWEDGLPADPRSRPWYLGAVNSPGSIHWTEPYEYTTGPEIGISASLLMDGDDPEASKILILDLTLDDLNEFVERLHLTQNQGVFLLDGDRRQVIAFQHDADVPDLDPLAYSVLLSPAALQSDPLNSMLELGKQQLPVRFRAAGELWWGVSRLYEISDHQQLAIVSLLPESDFASEINRTIWVGSGAFFLILLLSLMVVRNHNRLHRLSGTLADRNRVISEQKKVLFSEVHHRVKNNLALISAFLELELMKQESPDDRVPLKRNMQRIKIISLVQEEVYKSEKLGTVELKAIFKQIESYYGRTTLSPSVAMQSDSIEININQAMTFGLLLHELLIVLSEMNPSNGASCRLSAQLADETVSVRIRNEDIPIQKEWVMDLADKDLIRALSKQLGAELNFEDESAPSLHIHFLRRERRGIVGNRFYFSHSQ